MGAPASAAPEAAEPAVARRAASAATFRAPALPPPLPALPSSLPALPSPLPAPEPPTSATVPSPVETRAARAPAPVANAYAAAGDPSPAVRLALARRLATDPTPRAMVLTWLLAQDPLPEVAVAAAEAAVARCAQEAPAVCVATLGFFLDGGGDTPAAGVARDGLWTYAPAQAADGATPAERLAAVQRLAPRLVAVRPDRPAERVLRLLAEDADPEVQQAAAAALMALDR